MTYGLNLTNSVTKLIARQLRLNFGLKWILIDTNIFEDNDRYVVLCWDKVIIKENLVSDKHICELVGFTNLGDINNRLYRLQDSVIL